ncbi:hypothetical protein J6590_021577 [Homalodisca vitripennis]|nr:hypothetical protein J6590_021577 [Homalodisca vitripennis]
MSRRASQPVNVGGGVKQNESSHRLARYHDCTECFNQENDGVVLFVVASQPMNRGRGQTERKLPPTRSLPRLYRMFQSRKRRRGALRGGVAADEQGEGSNRTKAPTDSLVTTIVPNVSIKKTTAWCSSWWRGGVKQNESSHRLTTIVPNDSIEKRTAVGGVRWPWPTRTANYGRIHTHLHTLDEPNNISYFTAWPGLGLQFVRKTFITHSHSHMHVPPDKYGLNTLRISLTREPGPARPLAHLGQSCPSSAPLVYLLTRGVWDMGCLIRIMLR